MKKILFVTAHSYDSFPIESNLEYLEVLKMKSKSICDNDFHIIPLPNADKIDIIEYLEDVKPYILHFSSHGNDKGEPILFDKFNIKPESFSEILKEIKSIECIFLNSCNSYEFIQKMKGGIRYYIGMTGEIPVKSSIQFSKNFYKHLFKGRAIYESFKYAYDAVKYYKDKGYEPMLELDIFIKTENPIEMEYLDKLPAEFQVKLAEIQKTIDQKGNSLSGRLLDKHPSRTLVQWFISRKTLLAYSIANKVYKDKHPDCQEDLAWDLNAHFKLLDPLLVSINGKELLKKENLSTLTRTQENQVYIDCLLELIYQAKNEYLDLENETIYFEDRVKYFIDMIKNQ